MQTTSYKNVRARLENEQRRRDILKYASPNTLYKAHQRNANAVSKHIQGLSDNYDRIVRMFESSKRKMKASEIDNLNYMLKINKRLINKQKRAVSPRGVNQYERQAAAIARIAQSQKPRENANWKAMERRLQALRV